jgi:hypothetical protein
VVCSNFPGSLLQSHLAAHVTLAGGQITTRRSLRWFGLLDQCHTDYRFVLRIRNLPSRRLYVLNPVTTPKDLRGLVGGKIREEPIIANWPIIGREPSDERRALRQLSVVVSLNTYMFLAANSGLKISSSKFKTRCTPTFVQV